MTDQPVRAAIYARISHDADADGLGVARQEAECRARAERDGLSVVGKPYTDNDISASASSTKQRQEYARMLEGARNGLFGVVLAYSNSRLTRRPRELEDLIDLHDRYGTRFLTVVSGDDDLGTADGRMVARLKASIDAGEAERTSERLRGKTAELARAGRHNGPRPFGWDITGQGKDQNLVVNEIEAAVLRECVQRVLDGDAIWKITKDLNSRGIRTSTERAWQTQVLRRVLLRDRNAGYRLHQPRRHGKPHGRATRYEGQWGAIIDEETHDRVVAKLTDPSRRTNNRGTAPKYLLTSIAFCGECGGHLVGVKEYEYTIKSPYERKDGTRAADRQRVYPAHYKCPAAGCMKVTRRMDEMDEDITGEVLFVLERDGVKLLGGDPVAAERARERIAALEAKLALAAEQWANTAMGGSDGGLGMTDDQLRNTNKLFQPKLDEERARLVDAQPASGLSEFTGSGVPEAWDGAGIETRKAVLRTLGMRITAHRVGPGNGTGGYDPDTVTIEWPDAAAKRISVVPTTGAR